MNEILNKIANALIANLDNTQTPGLFYGKMGISLFLYRYAKYSENIVYSDIADSLMDDIFDKLTPDLSPSAMDGVASIGYGLCHLFKEQSLEGEPDDVLQDMDERMFRKVRTELYKEMSFPIPVYSSGLYLLSRLPYSESEKKEQWIGAVMDTGIHFILVNVKKENYVPKLSLLNSMLFVFERLYNHTQKNVDNIMQLLDDLLLLALSAAKEDSSDYFQKVILIKIISELPDKIKLKYNPQITKVALEKLPINDIELWSDNLWWLLLYEMPSLYYFTENELEHYIDEKMMNLYFDITTINSKLAVIGLWLMQANTK